MKPHPPGVVRGVVGDVISVVDSDNWVDWVLLAGVEVDSIVLVAVVGVDWVLLAVDDDPGAV